MEAERSTDSSLSAQRAHQPLTPYACALTLSTTHTHARTHMHTKTPFPILSHSAEAAAVLSEHFTTGHFVCVSVMHEH